MSGVRIEPVARCRARLRVPGDKSIGHRALLLNALASGSATVRNAPPGGDLRSTREALVALGARIERRNEELVVRGVAPWRSARPIDCGNAGTTARLLLGILAPRARGAVTLTGDRSLSARPMGRVVEPLRGMGAAIDAAPGRAGRLPLTVTGRPLCGASHRLAVASAQVKSALLLAGLAAEGETVVEEPGASRDHTERMLRAMGAAVEAAPVAGGGRGVRLAPSPLAPLDVDVPGDLSSAAPFLALAAGREGSWVRVEDVGLNPTRTGFLDLLRRFGAEVETAVETAAPEPRGWVRVTGRGLHGIRVGPDDVPGAIDELPLVAVLGALADGETLIAGAAELRVKESDRIEGVVRGLRALGAGADATPDGLVVRGPARLRGSALDAAGDHRIGMALAVAATFAEGPSRLAGAEWIAVSYPGFLADLATCGGSGVPA